MSGERPTLDLSKRDRDKMLETALRRSDEILRGEGTVSYGLDQFNIEERLKRAEKQRAEAARIRCPQCDTIVYEIGAGFEDHPVSYWGEDTHTVWCSECDLDFEVQEHVVRTYTVLG